MTSVSDKGSFSLHPDRYGRKRCRARVRPESRILARARALCWPPAEQVSPPLSLALPLLPHFSALAREYDVVLSDVWGVIHNGIAAHLHACDALMRMRADRKSTRLNSSHLGISYAVFCLKK